MTEQPTDNIVVEAHTGHARWHLAKIIEVPAAAAGPPLTLDGIREAPEASGVTGRDQRGNQCLVSGQAHGCGRSRKRLSESRNNVKTKPLKCSEVA